MLTKGRERQLLDWLFERKAQQPERITEAKRDRYVECYSRPGDMMQAFKYYRALATSAAQNLALGERCLIMPVLALGGQSVVALV